MYICPNCNFASETEMKFCPNCGSTIGETTQALTPAVVAEPTLEKPTPQYSFVKGIVGMALSIDGLILSIIFLLYTLMFALISTQAGLVMSSLVNVYTLPPIIIGFVFTHRNAKLGDNSAFVRIGKRISVIGLILAGLVTLIGFICLANIIR